ncbi:MAG: sporulation initiation factor Spo0A C-terminal domain-containing protein [Clostridia bacterium]|nr:sporulation initiation factor Spo0A C-terminal domain-containing protein [Clostridia bacterium]
MTDEEREAVYAQFADLQDDREALLDAVTDATLHALRVPVKLLGYQYIFLGARYILSRPSNEHPTMLKEIYPYVAVRVSSNRVMVERAMHYAICCAWKRADPDIMYSYLGLRGRDLKNPPTNVEFLYLIAERVRLIVGDPEGEERYQRMKREAERRFGLVFR